MNYDFERLHRALKEATDELLAARAPGGPWVGELSSSALSTATAVCALAVVHKAQAPGAGQASPDHADAPTAVPPPSPLSSAIANGLAWLAQHVNGDGGWGDTVRSLSNLSTTALCWSAFGLAPGAEAKYRPTVEGAERWLKQRAGRIEPHILVPAIIHRYGQDRTFSVPILMTCALAGRLGPASEAWRWVLPLPFELAALPREWFAALRLPVVSYALPALIAIGQARHYHQPSKNPLRRLARVLTRDRTLRVLDQIQPTNGGFLEATPLTSFVTMALASSGQARHPVVARAVQFLLASAREDGSWAIDTNLATWLSTLALNALEAPAGDPACRLGPEECVALRWWLLRQQYRTVHPYTQAAPGGWAWTDLPGGVPDADDTAGALLALRQLGPLSPEVLEAAIAGIHWLLDLQNGDGGMPTFCRGWGALPFDRSSADLTAHALRAWLAWLDALPPEMQHRTQPAMSQAVRFLIQAQREDGAWLPLWFGNQFAGDEQNPTYGTARVVRTLPELAARAYLELVEPMNDGAQWLVKAQNRDGGWGGYPGGASTVEETGVTVEALAELMVYPQALLPDIREAVQSACVWGTNWLVSQVESGTWRQPAPIGFYFAKLWYYERLYPLIFTVDALRKVSKLGKAPGLAP